MTSTRFGELPAYPPERTRVKYQSRTTPGYLLAAIAAATVLAATAGCDTPAAGGPQELGVCVDPVTSIRVDDSNCHPGAGYVMDYFNVDDDPGLVIVPVRQRMVFPRTLVIVHTPPAGRSVSLAVPAGGGTATNVRAVIAKTAPAPAATASPKPAGTRSPAVTRGGLGVKSTSSSGTGSSSGARVSAGS